MAIYWGIAGLVLLATTVPTLIKSARLLILMINEKKLSGGTTSLCLIFTTLATFSGSLYYIETAWYRPFSCSSGRDDAQRYLLVMLPSGMYALCTCVCIILMALMWFVSRMFFHVPFIEGAVLIGCLIFTGLMSTLHQR